MIYTTCPFVTIKSSQAFDTIIIVSIKYKVNVCNLLLVYHIFSEILNEGSNSPLTWPCNIPEDSTTI